MPARAFTEFDSCIAEKMIDYEMKRTPIDVEMLGSTLVHALA